MYCFSTCNAIFNTQLTHGSVSLVTLILASSLALLTLSSVLLLSDSLGQTQVLEGSRHFLLRLSASCFSHFAVCTAVILQFVVSSIQALENSGSVSLDWAWEFARLPGTEDDSEQVVLRAHCTKQQFFPWVTFWLKMADAVPTLSHLHPESASCCSVAKLCLTLQPHGLQHARLPCPSPAPWACSNACPLSQRCHPTISSSVVSFSCLQSFPASGSFPMCWFFASCGRSIVASWI